MAQYTKLNLKGLTRSMPSWVNGKTNSPLLDVFSSVKPTIVKAGNKTDSSGPDQPFTAEENGAAGGGINYMPAATKPLETPIDIDGNMDNESNTHDYNNSNDNEEKYFEEQQSPTTLVTPYIDEPCETDPLQPDSRSETNEKPTLESMLATPCPTIHAPPTPTSGIPLRLLFEPLTGQSDADNDDTKVQSVDNKVQQGKLPSLERKIIRWVGVHHHNPGRSHSVDASFTKENNTSDDTRCTPTTPHIVVTADDNNLSERQEPDFEVFNKQQLGLQGRNTSASCNELCANKSNLLQNNTTVPDTTNHSNSTSYLSPEIELCLQRKTRYNSMLGMMRHATSANTLLQSGTGQQQQQQLLFTPPVTTVNLRHVASKSSLAPSNGDWQHEANDSMIACLSALYCKILVVMGLAFPIGEFISGMMPLYIYKGFYMYLKLGSIGFLIYAYMFLLQVVPLPKVEIKSRLKNLNRYRRGNLNGENSGGGGGGGPSDAGGVADDNRSVSILPSCKNYTITESTHESMYLKMGAMVFGIGSMIYSGLEVGQYFDLESRPECEDVLLVITPVSRMCFTFIQMYFIFLNSRVAINKHRTIARFGLMHMIATNLCIWLHVLVEETKHEIHALTHDSHDADEDHENGLGRVVAQVVDSALRNGTALLHGTAMGGHGEDDDHHHVVHRSAPDASAHHAISIYDCRKSDMMSRVVDNASPFLYPCTIEYSLLCSGVLYIIWGHINKPESVHGGGTSGDSDISTFIARKARHHYSVDCAHATRGLFMGILVLVLTIISLILFFVLISNESTKHLAVMEACIIELSVYSVAIVALIVALVQTRELEFVEEEEPELDNILLIIAQVGTYIYTCFTIIGGNFGLDSGRIMLFATAVITLIETTLQTFFILQASRRCCYTYDQLTRKPGREMVTFLLICNLAMWAISTFETSRADSHPVLLSYYGVWAWTIISHVSMPLAIFYRFHATVCLCEIWKRSYKLKRDYI